jgi:hypothetical protein
MCLSVCLAKKRFRKTLGCVHEKYTTILCDNNSSKKLSKNLILHDRSKHIDIKFHFLHELVKDSVVNLSQSNTQD